MNVLCKWGAPVMSRLPPSLGPRQLWNGRPTARIAWQLGLHAAFPRARCIWTGCGRIRIASAAPSRAVVAANRGSSAGEGAARAFGPRNPSPSCSNARVRLETCCPAPAYPSTPARKALVCASRGLSSTCFAGPVSTILPAFMNATSSAMRRACPMLWVTTTIA